jgi:hypothetical protein
MAQEHLFDTDDILNMMVQNAKSNQKYRNAALIIGAFSWGLTEAELSRVIVCYS